VRAPSASEGHLLQNFPALHGHIGLSASPVTPHRVLAGQRGSIRSRPARLWPDCAALPMLCPSWPIVFFSAGPFFRPFGPRLGSRPCATVFHRGFAPLRASLLCYFLWVQFSTASFLQIVAGCSFLLSPAESLLAFDHRRPGLHTHRPGAPNARTPVSFFRPVWRCFPHPFF